MFPQPVEDGQPNTCHYRQDHTAAGNAAAQAVEQLGRSLRGYSEHHHLGVRDHLQVVRGRPYPVGPGQVLPAFLIRI